MATPRAFALDPDDVVVVIRASGLPSPPAAPSIGAVDRPMWRGRVGSSGEAVHSAAKDGVIAFIKAVAREMARHQINVNQPRMPGPHRHSLFASIGVDNPKLRDALTKAIPFRKLADTKDVANAVAFFASDEADYITGQTVSVSGGLGIGHSIPACSDPLETNKI